MSLSNENKGIIVHQTPQRHSEFNDTIPDGVGLAVHLGYNVDPHHRKGKPLCGQFLQGLWGGGGGGFIYLFLRHNQNADRGNANVIRLPFIVRKDTGG